MKKILIGVVAVIVLLPSLAFAQVGDVNPNPASSCISLINNLQYLSTDANTNGEVSLLQAFLQKTGYASFEPSGTFGLFTKQAVKKFQRAQGFSVINGYVGQVTRDRIKALSCSVTTSNTPTKQIILIPSTQSVQAKAVISTQPQTSVAATPVTSATVSTTVVPQTVSITSSTQTTSSKPTIFGTASGVSTINIGLLKYGNGWQPSYKANPTPVVNGVWSVTFSTEIGPGSYKVSIYNENYNLLTTSGLTVSLPVQAVTQTTQTQTTQAAVTTTVTTPKASITSPTQTTSSKPTISGTASGVSTVTVILNRNGQQVYSSGAVAVVGNAWTTTISKQLESGSYSISIKNSDNNLLTTGGLTVSLPVQTTTQTTQTQTNQTQTTQTQATQAQTTQTAVTTTPTTPTTPSAPTNPAGICSSDGKAATVSWTLPSNTNALVRAYDTTLYGTDTNNSCNGKGVCVAVNAPSYSFATIPGHTYAWWAHSNNSNGYSSPVGGSITCIAHPITPFTTNSVSNATQNVTMPAATVSLKTDAVYVDYNTAANITWTSENAVSCTASGAWTGSKLTSGTLNTGALTENKEYILTCKNTANKETDPARVVVKVKPHISIIAIPPTVDYGNSATLSWNVTNALSCVASQAWTGSQALSGTITTAPLKESQTFTLTCQKESGYSSSASVRINVNPQAAPVAVTPAPVAKFCYTFQNDLQQGSTGADVAALHTVLSKEGYNVDISERNNQTFGITTNQSIGPLKIKYGVAKVGDPISGKFGINIRTAINNVYGCKVSIGAYMSQQVANVFSPVQWFLKEIGVVK